MDWGNVPGFLALFVALWALIENKRTARRQQTADLRDQATQWSCRRSVRGMSMASQGGSKSWRELRTSAHTPSATCG